MRTALYARVSTSDQRPEVQLHQLREYAGARGLAVTDEYVDHGVSATKVGRPALERMLNAARRREIDAVAVIKLDRIARSVQHLTALGAELEALGVDLIVLDQAIDTSTPAGRLLFNVLGSIAEFERDLIIERTKAGVEAARRRGKRIGRPEATDQRGRERILRLKKAGKLTNHEIAETVGVSMSTVARVARAAAGTRS